MNFSMSKLMSSLQSKEGVIKLASNVMNVEQASNFYFVPEGKKEKRKKSSVKGSRVELAPKIGKSKGKGKGKKDGNAEGKCFYCFFHLSPKSTWYRDFPSPSDKGQTTCPNLPK